jgi:CRISPR/Cas system-associated exonuclease Cas4 (RecB family)
VSDVLFPDLSTGKLHERNPDYISVSELREYLSCPLRWWYKYKMGMWTERTTPFFALGTAVHSGLAIYYGNKSNKLSGGKAKEFALRGFSETYQQEAEKVDWSLETTRDVLTDGAVGQEMLEAAITAGDDWVPHKDGGIEKTFMAEIKHSKLGPLPIKLKATVDMLLDNKNVVEHKTAERKWEQGREHGDIQATAYVMAVRDNFGHDPEVTFNIISKSAKGPNVDRRPTRRNQEQIDRLYIQVRSFLDSREKGAVYPNPTAFAHEKCEYRALCDKWESHPQELPETRSGLKLLVPTLADNAIKTLQDPPVLR